MHDIREHRPINDCLGRNAGFPGFVQYKLYCLALCSPTRIPPPPFHFFARSTRLGSSPPPLPVLPLKIREFMRVTFHPITLTPLSVVAHARPPSTGRASLIDGPPFVLGGRRY